MQANHATPPSTQPSGTTMHQYGELATAAPAALIISFIFVLAYGYFAPAPPGTRLYVALIWLGYWAAAFLLTFLFALPVAVVCRSLKAHPLVEFVIVLLASLFGILLLGLLVYPPCTLCD